MAENPLRQLEACGVSVWSDFIRRSWLDNGDFQRLIDEDGISGVTSNPTIFEKAIAGSSDYDDQLRELVGQGITEPEQVFRRIAAKDIGHAADMLRPTYDRSEGRDGFVSVEVSPAAAHDTRKTMEDAHYYWSTINRPNIMIKIPGTPEGLPAVEQALSEGINVNITLLFAVEVYEQVIEAYLRGLERRVEAGGDISRVASVASFFVSRVDTLTDKLLEEKAGEAQNKEELKALEGKSAVNNAKLAYELFERIFSSDRFKKLADKGARVQKVLWASTSTKNPSYPDTMYVTDLVGPDTVNTMPPQTIVAVRDHGVIECDTVKQGVDEAHRYFDRLRAFGIEMDKVTDQLTAEGVKSFSDSQIGLFQAIEEKVKKLQGGGNGGYQASLDGQHADVEKSLEQMSSKNFIRRLWDKDPALWKPNPAQQSEITDRLGWLHVSDCMREQKGRLDDIARQVREAGYSYAVVLGMGGSSLAPYVLASSFGRQSGYPELLVLDSTDPEAVQRMQETVDRTNTLFLVSTKSGGTTETLSFFKTFWEWVEEESGDATGKQFVAITDPGTSLQTLAEEHKFRACFLNPADIGGRYSALSYFGLVPAAVAGFDYEHLLDRAERMEHACAPSVNPKENPGAWLGTVMADLAKSGRNKVTFLLSPSISTFGLWLEQLLAESTGKEGKGLVPVVDNPAGTPNDYADDHIFIGVSLKGDRTNNLETALDGLAKAGNPVVRLELQDLYDLGAEFFRWEFATAVAGALLEINAFDQPNVQESKDNTKRVLEEYHRGHLLPEPNFVARANGIGLVANDAAQDLVGSSLRQGLEAGIAAYVEQVKAPEYFAIMAYVAPTPENDRVLKDLRVTVRDARRVATTFGYGPRFLHSTGQLHKGGPPQGVFLQITCDAAEDLEIPGSGYTYQTLIHAQALGDLESLQNQGRPAVRLHLPDESPDTLRRVVDLIQHSLSATPVA